MKRLLVVFAVTLIFMPGLSLADVLKMQPGQWEIAVNMHMTGLPVSIPTQVLKKCITAEDMKNTENGIMQPQNLPGTKQQCKISKLSHTGNTLSWQGSCMGDNDIRAPLKIDLLLSGGVKNDLAILMYWHIHSGCSAIFAYPETKIS
ncbi:MAG: DUF3617 domain-containing protein, partial [Gammaproteobacteria bacterium]